MNELWLGMSYNRFPVFTSSFQRSAYEEWQEYLDIYNEEFEWKEETEDNECLDWKSRFMSIL